MGLWGVAVESGHCIGVGIAIDVTACTISLEPMNGIIMSFGYA